MKKMKRILTLILTVCLLLPCFSIVTYAADGVIFFDDLKTTVGAKFKVKGTVVAKNAIIGEASVEMTYDPSYIRFIEGEGLVKTGDGVLTFKGEGNGQRDRIEFTMEFQALKEGTLRIKQGATTVKKKDGTAVVCESGFSDIKIGPGDPSLIKDETDGNIEVDGLTYSVSSGFSDNLIPKGFVRGEISYQGKVFQGIVHETADLQGLYLKDSQGVSGFYLYNASEDTFYPCEEIALSEESSLIILAELPDVKINTRKYLEASMTINGTEFPAWSIANHDDYYVVYALGPNGEKGFYTYDSVEYTYQRMQISAQDMAEEEKKEEVAKTKIDKLLALIEKNLVIVVVAVACIFVILLILIIVLSVKLRNRNLELDDLYDEYGIDLDEEPAPAKAAKKAKSKPERPAAPARPRSTAPQTRKEKFTEYYEEDDFDDGYEDDYEDDYEEDYEDDLLELRRDYGSKQPAKDKKRYDSYYDDDDYDYEDDRAGLKESVNTDTFEMDFIDFD